MVSRQEKKWRRAIDGMRTFLERMPGTPRERMIQAYRLLHGAVDANKIEAVYMGFCAFANSLNQDGKTIIVMRVPEGRRFYSEDRCMTVKDEDPLPGWLPDTVIN